MTAMAVIMQQLANASSAPATDASALEASISALKRTISALESCIKTLEGASGFWEKFGWLCAIAVGVGIAGELVVIVWEYREDLHEWRRGLVRPPDHPNVTRLWFDLIATVVVLAGVFGEAGATGKVASINNELRSKTILLRAYSDELLSLVTQEAGDAKQSAIQAGAAAAGAIASGADARTLAQKARVDANAAGVSAKHIGQLETDLQAETESAELMLTASATGHTFRARVFSALGYLKPARADVECASSDFLDLEFATSLQRSLKNRFRWNVSGLSKYGIDDPLNGVSIFNPWVSTDEAIFGVFGSTSAPSFLQRSLEAKGVPRSESQRLSILALALGAKLRKVPSGDGPLFVIEVGHRDIAPPK